MLLNLSLFSGKSSGGQLVMDITYFQLIQAI